MTDFTQQLESFKLLDYQVQKEKILVMLEKLQNVHVFLKVLYTTLQTLESPSADTLYAIYDTLFSLADYVDGAKVEQINSAVDALKNRLRSIQEAEYLDKEKEWDPELLLQIL